MIYGTDCNWVIKVFNILRDKQNDYIYGTYLLNKNSWLGTRSQLKNMSVHVRPKGFRFAIDRGGTFTDVYAECPNGQVRIIKLLSEDPGKYADAPREAIRRILEEVSSI